jgi:hypothetical protein
MGRRADQIRYLTIGGCKALFPDLNGARRSGNPETSPLPSITYLRLSADISVHLR